jgi:thioredoxin reductase
MTTQIWDSIIIGAGAAGLSAAQMLGRSRRRVLVIDAGQPRNRFAATMHGVLGNDGTDPADLLRRGHAEAESYGVEFTSATVDTVTDHGDHLEVVVESDSEPETKIHKARSLILATGVWDKLPEVAGLKERWGHSVLHCPYCHGWEVRDQRLAVLIDNAPQVHMAHLVRQLSEDVTVFAAPRVGLAQEEIARLASRGVSVVDSPVVSIDGAGRDIDVVRTEDGSEFAIDALFAPTGLIPQDTMLEPLGLLRADTPAGSFIEADAVGKTSNARVWAAGNVVAAWATVPVAMATGASAGGAVNAALAAEDFDAAYAATRA